jgi:hypothetical protein
MSRTQGGAAAAHEPRETEPREDGVLHATIGEVTHLVETDAPRPTVDEHAGATDEAIARRAYELYLARGGEHGSDMNDWIQAECELRGPDNTQR